MLAACGSTTLTMITFAITLRDGEDATLIGNGTVLWRALVAAEQLQDQGMSARVIFHVRCETAGY
jgi:transketolase C-terminal domain/subunit